MEQPIRLTPRLRAVAALVPDGARVADIGTDHAYLPVWLVERHKAPGAIAADVREGPLSRARDTVRQAGLERQIRCLLSDGLAAVPPEEVDTLVFAGMGGMLIRDLLRASPWIRQERFTFVFQPMTHGEELRFYLYRNGFRITKEVFVREGKHSYCIFSASYDGVARPVGWEHCFVSGAAELGTPAAVQYLQRQLRYLRKKQWGIQKERDQGQQARLCQEAAAYLESLLEEQV